MSNRAWNITIPKTTSWDQYEAELVAVKDGTMSLNYKTRYFPKEMQIGDRCYVTWNGRVRGWMKITDMVENDQKWVCQTTGTVWPPGKYIRRSGPWHPVDGPEMTGFRGIRKYNEGD